MKIKIKKLSVCCDEVLENDVNEVQTQLDKDEMSCNDPKRTTKHPKKSHVVKACKKGKEKIIRFGEQGASTAGEPKKGESKKMKAKRKSFKARHGKNIKKGNMSAAYWADKVKWENVNLNPEELIREVNRLLENTENFEDKKIKTEETEMKITKNRLREMIKEELERVVSEMQADHTNHEQRRVAKLMAKIMAGISAKKITDIEKVLDKDPASPEIEKVLDKDPASQYLEPTAAERKM